MKYLPTLDLWNNSINSAVRSGQIKLQKGQWILCGNQKKSRFVGVKKSGTIWAVHPQGKKPISQEQFKALCNAFVK